VKVMRIFGAVMIGALLTAAGCETVENVRNDPTNQRREITASSYSLDSCQKKMDELAGKHVEMTGHTQAILVSVHNLGTTPPYICHGVISDGPTSPAAAQ
jgi:hypothetical protein